MSLNLLVRLAAVLAVTTSLSGCLAASVATTVMQNEDVQDAAIDGMLDFLDI